MRLHCTKTGICDQQPYLLDQSCGFEEARIPDVMRKLYHGELTWSLCARRFVLAQCTAYAGLQIEYVGFVFPAVLQILMSKPRSGMVGVPMYENTYTCTAMSIYVSEYRGSCSSSYFTRLSLTHITPILMHARLRCHYRWKRYKAI